MTYQDTENSVRGAAPIELYKFEGTYEDYYYTTAARKIRYLGKDYMPIPMQRSEINAGTENDDGLDISVDLPVSAQLVLVYGFEAAPPKLNLTIYRYHNQAEVVKYWIGPVSSITTNDGMASIRSTSELGALLSQDFPNVYFQGPCNNVLFDRRCKVIETDFSGGCVLQTFNGRSLVVDAIPVGGAGRALDGLLVGGEVMLASGERRMIVSQVGPVIVVNFPFSRIEEEAELYVTAGCDHGYETDCKLKFNNQVNYGGFPFISGENKFTDGIEEGSTLPIDATCLPVKFEGWYWQVTIHTIRESIDNSEHCLAGSAFGGDWTVTETDYQRWRYVQRSSVDHPKGYAVTGVVQLSRGCTPGGTVCLEPWPETPDFCTTVIECIHWTDPDNVIRIAMWQQGHGYPIDIKGYLGLPSNSIPA